MITKDKILTIKEACELTGRTEHFMRNHECAWCGVTLLNAIRYGCGSGLGPGQEDDCEPATRRKPWWTSK